MNRSQRPLPSAHLTAAAVLRRARGLAHVMVRCEIKLLFARGAAEVIHLPFELRSSSGSRRLNIHPAHGIFHDCCNGHCISPSVRELMTLLGRPRCQRSTVGTCDRMGLYKRERTTRTSKPGVIPQVDDRLVQVVAIAQHAQRRSHQVKMAAFRCGRTKPAGREDAQDVPVRKQQHVASRRTAA